MSHKQTFHASAQDLNAPTYRAGYRFAYGLGTLRVLWWAWRMLGHHGAGRVTITRNGWAERGARR